MQRFLSYFPQISDLVPQQLIRRSDGKLIGSKRASKTFVYYGAANLPPEFGHLKTAVPKAAKPRAPHEPRKICSLVNSRILRHRAQSLDEIGVDV